MGIDLKSYLKNSQRRWLELIKKGNICHECDRRWIPGHLSEDKSLHYSKIVEENEVGILNPANKITSEYNSELDKDKASRMTNEHREGVD